MSHGLAARKTRLAQSARTKTAGLRLIPDFLIIGGMRCGTTTLYRYLAQHPSLGFACRKEVHFFDWHYSKGERWYRGHFPSVLHRWKAERKGLRFLAGEASPSYVFYPSIPGRVARLLPDARFILLLRNPVNRAYSHYQKSKFKKREPLSFEDALREEESRLSEDWELATNAVDFRGFHWINHSYKARGRYVEQVRRWLDHFPPERFLFLQSEDMFRDPRLTMHRVAEFLDVPAVDLVQPLRANSGGGYEPMQAETRERLTEYFRTYNQALYELVGIDFGWDS